MKISTSEIQRLFKDGFRNYIIARRYFNSDILEDIYIELTKTNRYKVRVVYNDYQKKGEAHFTISYDGRVIDYECDCFYCSETSPCAHIGAALLYLSENTIIEFPFHKSFAQERLEARQRYLLELNRRKAQELIHQFENIANEEMDFEEVFNVGLYAQTEVIDHEIEVEYKIGTDKLYVLKNLNNFIKAINSQERVTYGKKFSFVHKKDKFDTSSQQQIMFIQETLAKSTTYSGYNYLNRKLYVNKQSLDDFFEIYSKLNSKYIDMSFRKEKLKDFEMKVSKEDDFYYFELCLNHEWLLEGNRYWYYLENQQLQRFDEILSHQCSLIFNHCIGGSAIQIYKDDIQEFCRVVYSQIRPYVKIDETLIEEFIVEELQLATYIDLDEEGNVISDVYIKGELNQQKANLNSDEVKIKKIKYIFDHYQATYSATLHQAIITFKNDLTSHFVEYGLGLLKKYSEVYVSENIRNMEKPHSMRLNVGVRIENDLLKIDVDSIDIPREELFDVLKNYRRKNKFHRLKDGKIIRLDDESINEVSQLFDELQINEKDLNQDEIELDRYRAFLLEQKESSSNHLILKRDQSFNQLIKNIQNIEYQNYQVPVPYQNILRDYQVFGYQWLKTISDYGFGGILADDMGLGKTLQVITLLEEAGYQNQGTSIVITPASLIYNWQDEIHKFSKTLKCLCITGSAKVRTELIHSIKQYDIIITSYDYMRKDYELYQQELFNYIIIDEAQYIKNHTTKNAFAIKQLKGKHKFALTGTPIENSLAELWSIFDFLMPNYLYNYHYFKTHYENDIVKSNDEQKQLALKQMVEPFILRRHKKEVLKELPDKIENVHKIEFSKEESKLYLANLTQINQELQEKLKVEKQIDKFAVLAMMTRLRQLCCDNRLVYENIDSTGSKLKACMELIEQAKDQQQKVLLFSSFTSMLTLIEEQLQKQNISYYLLTGATSKDLRRQLVNDFQNDKTTVFLISLKAGGTGLNLTSAQIVIHFDPWWNISAQNQATDRAYRIGQTKNVFVHKLIIKDSIEEKIQILQEQKKNLADTFIEENQGSITSMSKEEILSLFSE